MHNPRPKPVRIQPPNLCFWFFAHLLSLVARENQNLMNNLLRSELLGHALASPKHDKLEERSHHSPALHFQSSKRRASDRQSAPGNREACIWIFRGFNSFNGWKWMELGGSSMFPMSPDRGEDLYAPKKTKRKISKVPFKVCGRLYGFIWHNSSL